MALGSMASSLAEGEKQREALSEEAKRLGERRDESEQRQISAERAAKQPLEQAIAGQRVAASARDPFMEQAVQQGAYQQTADELRKGELAAGGVGAGGRVRSTAGARSAALAQGLMARESKRMENVRGLRKLIGQEAAQLSEITQTGMRTREQSLAGYEQAISKVRTDMAAIPDPAAVALRGATKFMGEAGMFGEEGMEGTIGGVNKFISGALGYKHADPNVEDAKGDFGFPLWDLFGMGGGWD